MKVKSKINPEMHYSGQSPLLRWLVESSLKETPWLMVNGTDIAIDWRSAIEARSKANPDIRANEGLVELLKKLAPSLALNHFRVGEHKHQRSRASNDDAYCAQISSASRRFSDSMFFTFREAFEDLGSVVNELSEILAAKGTSPWEKKGIEVFRNQLSKICLNEGSPYFRDDTFLLYPINERLSAAHMDRAKLILGTNTAFTGAGTARSNQRRAESWKLANRLIKAQVDFYRRLLDLSECPEEMWSQFFEVNCQPSLKVAHLAAKRLALCLNVSEETLGSPESFTRSLTTQVTGHAALEVGQKTNREIAKEFYYRRGYPGLFESLIRQIELCREVLRNLGGLTSLSKKQYILDKADKSLFRFIRAIEVERTPSSTHSSPTIDKAEIEDAFEWTIENSSVLTLLFSGVLGVYRTSDETTVGICLTPQLTCAVVSEKMLGVLPLTHLGLDTSESAESEEIENVEESGKEVISGTRLWDLVLGSLDRH